MSLHEFDEGVKSLILEMGSTGTYVSTPKGAYDPETGTVTGAAQSLAVNLILLDLTLQSNGMSLKYGTEVLAGDKEVYMLPPQKVGGVALKINPGADKIVIAGVTYSVVTFKEINPTGSDPVVFFLYVRR